MPAAWEVHLVPYKGFFHSTAQVSGDVQGYLLTCLAFPNFAAISNTLNIAWAPYPNGLWFRVSDFNKETY